MSRVLRRERMLGGGALVALALTLSGGSAWALGPAAPPVIRFAGAWFDGGQIVTQVRLAVPGGSVPADVTSVTVKTPGGLTLPLSLERLDLAPEGSYVRGFCTSSFNPACTSAGKFTFTVTDSAGGVTTAADTLHGPLIPIPAPTKLKVEDLVDLPPDPNNPAVPVALLLSLQRTPNPVVSWKRVNDAVGYEVTVGNGFGDQPLFALTTTETSVTLPAGIFVQGRRYFVRLRAFDDPGGFACTSTPGCVAVDANVVATSQIEIITTQGPEVLLRQTGGAADGQTLVIGATIINSGPPVTADILAWIGPPVGPPVSIAALRSVTIPSSPSGSFFDGSVLGHAFDGSEPTGHWVFGVRLVDSLTGDALALATTTFSR